MKTQTLAMALLLAAESLAFNVETEAFYAFLDGAAGTSADSVSQITNSVDGFTYPGVVSLVGSGAVEFSTNAPGAYILDGEDGATLARDPQSLDFGKGVAHSGSDYAKIDFSDVMDTLAQTNAFTIEFFFRKPTSLLGVDLANSTMARMNIWSNNQALTVYAPCDKQNSAGIYIQAYRRVYVDDPIQDGKWHHVAIRRKSKEIFFQYDYAHQGTNNTYKSYPCDEPKMAWATGPVQIGGSKFRGQISCLRISQKYLAPNELLRASNSPVYDPGDGDQQVRATTPIERTTSMDNWWENRHTQKLAEIAERGSEIETVFLGDSITHNWDSTIWNTSFAAWHPINLGYTADTTGHVLWRIANGELDGYTAKRVILLIGTNNRGSTGSDEPVQHTVRGIRAVLDAIQAKQPTAKIYLNAIFPRGDYDAEGIRKLRLVNDTIKDFADGESIIWCDYYDRFLNSDGTLNTTLFNSDQLHPNANGYAVWRDALMNITLEPVTLGALRQGTVAFYAFADAVPNAALDSTHVVSNSADAARFVGTPTIYEASGYEGTATCMYTTDAPGKYVFDGSGYNKTPFCTNPRSIYLWGDVPNLNGTVHSGAKVSFAGLANEMLSNSESTVEFFYKIPSSARNFNWFVNTSPFTWGTAGIQLPSHTSGTDTMNMVRLYATPDGSAPTTTASQTPRRDIKYPNYIKDDKWHHIAVVKKNGKLRMFCDYAKVTPDDLTAAPAPAEASPLVIGNYYRYCGYISCLRVVTKALTPGEMLFASDDPKCISDPTVAHWSMDGAPGEPMSQVDSVVTNDASPFSGQYFASVNQLDCAARLVNATVAPVATNATAFRKNAVYVGDNKLRENAGSATIGYDAVGKKHSVFTLYPTNHLPVRSGSFTFETFYRFDKDAWTAHKTGNTYCSIASKPAIVSSGGSSRGYDWWGGLWVYGTGYLQFNIATNVASASVLSTGLPFPAAIDNQWHHFAIVYDEENLTAKLYLDYQVRITHNLPAPLPRDLNPENDSLMVGQVAGGTPFQGMLDEIRYSRVALPVEQFLRAKSDRGVVIIFR